MSLKQIIVFFTTCIVLILFIYTSFYINRIKGESMEPTIKDNSYILKSFLSFGWRSTKKNTYLYSWAKPKRNDIVAFVVNVPSSKKSLNLVKRIVALEGDTIKMEDQELFIKYSKTNEFVKVSSGLKKESVDVLSKGFKIFNSNNLNSEYKLKKNEYWVIGDNYYTSLDSKYFGAISLDNIYAKVFNIF